MNDVQTWQNRWLITGTLSTVTPLHIGGDLPLLKDIYPMDDKGNKQRVEVTSVVTDCQNRAYIPGSTIKGNIRSWMQENGYDMNAIEQLFGSPHDKKASRLGGKMEFTDSFPDVTSPTFAEKPSYWDKDRLTAVYASVVIDRVTGAASDQKLFHLEFVPPGVSFNISISGQDVEEEYIKELVHALETGFKKGARKPITVGASTANGWGRFEWKPGYVKCMSRGDVQKWIKNPVPGYKMLEGLAAYPLMAAVKKGAIADKCLEISIKVMFDGPFLVNDQSKSRKVTGDDHKADMNPRRETNGNVSLPAASFRGALRAQAEKIIRTVGGHACTTRKPCKAITNTKDVKNLCLACRLFGASGWKTAIAIPQFELESCKNKEFRQDFLAIDRFTGGGKDGAKFDALSVLDPIFSGVIRIDMEKSGQWGLGLLALTLRDLKEGDITFGFGAAKGYGACQAIVGWPDDINLTELITQFELCIQGGK